MQATPQTDTVSPVPVADLAPFIGVEETDPLLAGMLQAATDAVIRYINLDLLEREWVGIVPVPQAGRLQLSPSIYTWPTFELPYTGLISIDAVTGNDDEVMDYTIEASRRPARITVHGWDRLSELRIEYTAGTAIIPEAVKTAILMAAAFFYEMRGGCEAGDALKKSGAAGLLRPYRVEVSI